MKKRAHTIPIILISFAAMALITIGAGYYKKSLAAETSAFKIAINGDKTTNDRTIIKPIVVDTNQEGLPKKIIQPTLISISGGITNSGNEALSLQLVNKGFNGKVTLNSSDNNFNSSNGEFKNLLKSSNSLKLSLLLDIPKDKLNQHEVSTGIINIINLKNKEIVGTIPIKVINSNIQGAGNNASLKDLERSGKQG